MLCDVFNVFDHRTFLKSIFRKFISINTNIVKNYIGGIELIPRSICLTLDTLLNLSNPGFHVKG